PRKVPVGGGKIRSQPQTALQVGIGLVEAPHVDQYLRTRQQRGRVVRVPSVGFVQELDRAFLLVEVAELRRDGQQHGDGDLVERRQLVDPLQDRLGLVEGAQAADQFHDQSRRGGFQRVDPQGTVACCPV